MIETYLIVDTKEWLAMRKKDVTSTEISILFGCNPYRSRLVKDVYEEDDSPPSEFMFWGNQLESCIAEGVAKLNNWRIEEFNDYIRDNEHRIGASFDYKIVDENGNPTAILEIKNVSSYSHRVFWAKNNELPSHIQLQVQQQMLLSGIKKAVVAAMIGGSYVKYYEVYPNLEIQEQIKQKALEFWKGELE